MKSRSKKAKKENNLAGEEGLDANSAFVHMAVKNRADIPQIASTSSGPHVNPSIYSSVNGVAPGNGPGFDGSGSGGANGPHGVGPKGSSYHLFDQDLESLPTHVREAQRLATRGNHMFVLKEYNKAVEFFTEAIKLDPQEVRFFGNRALCFEFMGDFEKALEDADTAISLQPSWPKGYFRKGSALEGLNRYEEGEKAFQWAIQYSGGNCPDAQEARRRVMTKQLTRLGFSEEQSTAAILHYSSVKQAADSLLATRLLSSSALTEIFDSDDEEALLNDRWKGTRCISRSHSSSNGHKSATPPIQDFRAGDPLVDPKNPLKWDTLWVGNLVPQTTEKMINTMFMKFGKIRNSHMMLDKHCCFVSFTEWKAAGDAMRELQGRDIHGQKILIKYPDRALANAGQNHKAAFGTVVLRKPSVSEMQPGGPGTPSSSSSASGTNGATVTGNKGKS